MRKNYLEDTKELSKMKFTIGGTDYHVPISWEAITFAKYLEWVNEWVMHFPTETEALTGEHKSTFLSDSKKRSPYLLLELAAYTYEANHTIARSFAIPFGFGYKSRLFKNINFSLETKFRNSLQNNLETNQNRRVKNNENDFSFI